MEINGKRVIDAKKPLKISISAKDANAGRNKDPARCAAAKAIMRIVPGAKGARVHLGCTYIETDEAWIRYRTPQGLKTEIVSFDRGTKPEYTEGEYTLYTHSPSAKLGAPKSSRLPGNPASRHQKSRRTGHSAPSGLA